MDSGAGGISSAPFLFSEDVCFRGSAGALDGDARDAGRNAGKDFPGDGAGGVGVVVGGDGLGALRAENDDFVAGFDAGDLSDVEHGLVHADAADERRALAANQKAEAIAEAAIEAVGVAGGEPARGAWARWRRRFRCSRRLRRREWCGRR